MEQSPKRMYTRYEFSAPAEIEDSSGSRVPAKVTNISYGGCRVLIQRRMVIRAPVVVRIKTQTEAFEAHAQVAHSGAEDAGLVFGDMAPQSLLVLRKWIQGMRTSADAR
jgi:PilZ domain